jgi:Zn-dependent protease with chaperone function
MTDAEFEALVARLEQQAQRSPAAYGRKVILLACVGYAYVALVLAIAGGLFVGALATAPYLKALAIKLAFIFGAFFWVVARAMWIRLEPPQGRRITPGEAPELFKMIDGLQRSLRAPPLHNVLITSDFNAAVVQVPRLGLLGWHYNTLLIGLPLMKALTRQQLAAVLAHEFGHLAGGHGRLGNWVYRVRYGWARLVHALQDRQSAGSFAFRPFLKWYAPYFSAVSFPLARANEYEADAASARLISPTAAAAALTNVNVIGSFLEARYWPDLHRKADEVPQPSFAPYAQMGEIIGAGFDSTAVSGWLEAAMAEKTSVANTHPALADRLRALGQPPLLALPSAGEAADMLLGRALEPITAGFDRGWREAIQPSWERRHREVQEARAELATLDARVTQGNALTLAERLQRARLTGNVGAGNEAALGQFCALHAEAPQNAVICYELGLRLLRSGDDAGVALIERAIAGDEDVLLPGAELLRDYYASRGRGLEARHWHARWLQRAQILHAAQAERSSIRLDDTFEPHGLDGAQIAALRAQLRAIPGVYRAYLVRKHVLQFADRPLLVLGFTTKPWWRRHNAKRAGRVQDEIAQTVPFPHEARIFCVEASNRRFGRKWRFVQGARVM